MNHITKFNLYIDFILTVYVDIILIMYIDIGLMGSGFTNGPGDRGLISGRVIPMIQKMVLDAALLNTQY